MFRFVSLFALVAVALAEPEADPQLLYNHVAGVPGVPGVNTYAAYAVNPFVPLVNTYATPVVKTVDPHHTEGMTKKGVPEKTDSVKIAEKHHEIAKIYENSKVVYNAGVYSPYTVGGVYNPYTVGGVYNPYTHGVVGYKTPYTIHHLGKREADSDADAQYFYHGYRYPSAYNYGYNPYPYVYTTPYAYGARSVYGYHY